MSEYHRTGQLTVVGSQPEVKTLQNGRFRQVYFCESANSDNTDYDNIDRILPSLGTLSNAQLAYDGISTTAAAYPDMRLVASGSEYIPSAGKHMVVLTYETITDTFVQIEDDAIDTELNGLRRVSRDRIAQVGTDYALVVGTSTISHQIDAETAVTLYLASAKITDSNSSRIVSETWLEAGTLTRGEDFVGSQKAITLQTIGADPSAPGGYSLARKSEGNYQGFQTNDFTFLKNNVRLSVSEDLVGSQKAQTQQWFNPASTKTLSGFDLARTQTSDFDGIETTSYTFLKPSVISVRTPLVGGQQTVVVSAFGMTEAAVNASLSEVTANHELIDVSKSDYDGFQTTNYTFEVDDFETIARAENGLKLLTRTQLSANNYGDGNVGTDVYGSLYLAGEEIDNGNTIKRRVSKWAEAGILQAYKGYQKDGLLLVTFESQGTAFTPTALNDSNSLTDAEHIAFTGGATAPLFRSRIINVNGFCRYVRSVLLLKDGAALVTGSTLTSKQVWHDVEYPGYVNLSRNKGIEPYSGSVIPVKATLVVKLTTSANVDATPPYSIKSGAYAEISFVPTETGIAQSISKAFGTRYLGGASLAGGGGTFLGSDVTALAGTVSSDPAYSVWLALSGQKLKYQHDEAFVTDEGAQWYRETTLTLIGAFSNYN
jgi:hypothetical protein